jgi:hypothetical protein
MRRDDGTMTITIDIEPAVLAALARAAAACGRSVEAHAAHLLEDAVQHPAERPPLADLERAQAAAARIRDLRKGVTLGGLTIRDLIDEGRP